MPHTYAPKFTETLATISTEASHPIHELRNQLIKERFVDKLVKLAQPSPEVIQDIEQPSSSRLNYQFWTYLGKKSIAATVMALSLASIAASPWGAQSAASLMAISTSNSSFESSDHTISKAAKAEDINAPKPNISPVLVPAPELSLSIQQRAFFMDMLWDEDTPPPAINSGLALGGLPLEHQAFLMTIAQAEGATYNTIYGGETFSSFSHHPQTCIPIHLPGYEGMCSDAAGKYQFLSSTWALLGLDDFSPKNQDRGAVMLIHETQAFTLLDQGNVAGAFCAVGRIWASLPCNSYGQNPKSLETIVTMYESNLQRLKSEN